MTFRTFVLLALPFTVGAVLFVLGLIELKRPLSPSHVAETNSPLVSDGSNDRKVWVKSSAAPPPRYDPEDLSQAALNRLFPKLDHPTSTSSITEVKQARVKLQCLRSWAENLRDEQVKNAYLDWLSFYDEQYSRYEKDLRDHSIPHKDAYEIELKAKQARADALQIPRPPARTCQPTEVTSHE